MLRQLEKETLITMEIEEMEQMAYHKLSMVESGLELRTVGPLQAMSKSYSPTIVFCYGSFLSPRH